MPPQIVINPAKKATFCQSPSNLFKNFHGLHHHNYLSAVINEFVKADELCVILAARGSSAEGTEARVEGRVWCRTKCEHGTKQVQGHSGTNLFVFVSED